MPSPLAQQTSDGIERHYGIEELPRTIVAPPEFPCIIADDFKSGRKYQNK
jgi:hypothetical protein